MSQRSKSQRFFALRVPLALAAVLSLSGSLLIFGSTAWAEDPSESSLSTLYVSASGDDGKDCRSVDTACKTIQTAINKAGEDDTIQVAAGLYEETLTSAKTLTIVGSGATITGSLAFTVNLSGTSRVEGFTFKRPAAVSASTSNYRQVAASGATHTVEIMNNIFDLQFGATTPVTRGRGAALSGTATWRVTGNTFLNQDWAGVYESRTLFFENAAPAIIHNNVFQSMGQAIYLTGSQPSGSSITANSFNGGDAITIGAPSGIEIVGNDFIGGNGITSISTPGLHVSNNRFTNPGNVLWQHGAVSGVVFRNNDINTPGYAESFGPPYGGKAIFSQTRNEVIPGVPDLSSNWWGSTNAPMIVADAGSFNNPVIIEPRITAYTPGTAPPGFVADRGFWPIINQVEASTPTPEGTNVEDTFVGLPNGGQVALTFADVNGAGTTTVIAFNPSDPTSFPVPPSGFSLGSSPVYYTITTTAEFTGSFELCLSYEPSSFSNLPTVYHFTDGQWNARPTSYRDGPPAQACATLTGFSQFALGVPDPTPTPTPVVPPSAPMNVGGIPQDRSVTVVWDAPDQPGSFPVSNYQVVATPGGAGCLAQSPALDCTVTGLTNGAAYTFVVRALNGAGWGPYSNPSDPVTPRVPDPRVLPTITIEGERGLVRGRPGVIVTGTSTRLQQGAILRAWIRFPGQAAYQRQPEQILVDTDGDFTWQRRTGKKIFISIRTDNGEVVSNRLILPKR